MKSRDLDSAILNSLVTDLRTPSETANVQLEKKLVVQSIRNSTADIEENINAQFNLEDILKNII